jgi:hypothetical protein
MGKIDRSLINVPQKTPRKLALWFDELPGSYLDKATREKKQSTGTWVLNVTPRELSHAGVTYFVKQVKVLGANTFLVQELARNQQWVLKLGRKGKGFENEKHDAETQLHYQLWRRVPNIVMPLVFHDCKVRLTKRSAEQSAKILPFGALPAKGAALSDSDIEKVTEALKEVTGLNDVGNEWASPANCLELGGRVVVHNFEQFV